MTPAGPRPTRGGTSRTAGVDRYRPGVAERLGLGPDQCLTCNPRLVYSRMTGWGQTGPVPAHPQAVALDAFVEIGGVLRPTPASRFTEVRPRSPLV